LKIIIEKYLEIQYVANCDRVEWPGWTDSPETCVFDSLVTQSHDQSINHLLLLPVSLLPMFLEITKPF